MINLKEMDNIIMKMANIIQANGKMDYVMEKENYFMLMEI